MSETQLVRDILVRLSAEPDVLVWRHNTGVATSFAGNTITFGLKGSPDIIGVVGPQGRFLGVECKTRRGRQAEQQRSFERAFTSRGGVYVLARSVEDALEAVARIRSEP